jgi:hypothetical protein
MLRKNAYFSVLLINFLFLGDAYASTSSGGALRAVERTLICSVILQDAVTRNSIAEVREQETIRVLRELDQLSTFVLKAPNAKPHYQSMKISAPIQNWSKKQKLKLSGRIRALLTNNESDIETMAYAIRGNEAIDQYFSSILEQAKVIEESAAIYVQDENRATPVILRGFGELNSNVYFNGFLAIYSISHAFSSGLQSNILSALWHAYIGVLCLRDGLASLREMYGKRDLLIQSDFLTNSKNKSLDADYLSVRSRTDLIPSSILQQVRATGVVSASELFVNKNAKLYAWPTVPNVPFLGKTKTAKTASHLTTDWVVHQPVNDEPTLYVVLRLHSKPYEKPRPPAPQPEEKMSEQGSWSVSQ